MYNIKPLENSMKNLGFTKQSNQNVSKASIKTMIQLLQGHSKAMKIKKKAISRYAAALIGHYRGNLNLPEPISTITQHEDLDNFIKSFVKFHFFNHDRKIHNITLFMKIFDVPSLDKRVSFNEIRRDPSPKKLLQYSIQKKPLLSFKTQENLDKIKQMNANRIKLLLTPEGNFNPKLSKINKARAIEFAVALTTKFAKTKDLNNRLKLATLVQQLQTTQRLNNQLLRNIRTSS
jgi:hypothetical protein